MTARDYDETITESKEVNMNGKIKVIGSLFLALMMIISLSSCSLWATNGGSSISDDTPLEDGDGLTIYENAAPLDEFGAVKPTEIPALTSSFPTEYFALNEELTFKVKTAGDEKKVTGNVKYTDIEAIFNRVNKERRDKGLAELKYDTTLQTGALQRSSEITVLWSHTRPDGTAWKTAAAKVNGENIAYGYKTAEAVMDGWMKSDGHRANILKSDFTRIGIGAFEHNGTIYWVQLFGF